jgi:hypothetical protein
MREEDAGPGRRFGLGKLQEGVTLIGRVLPYRRRGGTQEDKHPGPSIEGIHGPEVARENLARGIRTMMAEPP